MEKEINQNKKKIKIKANTRENKPFLLQKKFIYEETETLILNKVVQRKKFVPENKTKKTEINIATSNIIKLNEQSDKTSKNVFKDIKNIKNIRW